MEKNYQNDERYFEAKKKVMEIKGFYGHLTAFIACNIGFLVVNLLTTPEEIWFYWPMLGWGIGLLFHGLRVYNYVPFFGRNWEERKIKELIEKDNEIRTGFNN